MFDIYLREGFILVLVFSGIPLLISSSVGLVVSILQTATQIQDQTVSYVAKFSATAAIIALASNWFLSEFVRLFQEMLASISQLGRI